MGFYFMAFVSNLFPTLGGQPPVDLFTVCWPSAFDGIVFLAVEATEVATGSSVGATI
jgi:hypothetical protein